MTLEKMAQRWQEQCRQLDVLNEQGGGPDPEAFSRLCVEHDELGHELVQALLKNERLRTDEASTGKKVDIHENWPGYKRLLEENERLRADMDKMGTTAYVDTLKARIEAALELHSSNADGDCRSCSDDRNYTVEHPCWTVRALRGEED